MGSVVLPSGDLSIITAFPGAGVNCNVIDERDLSLVATWELDPGLGQARWRFAPWWPHLRAGSMSAFCLSRTRVYLCNGSLADQLLQLFGDLFASSLSRGSGT